MFSQVSGFDHPLGGIVAAPIAWCTQDLVDTVQLLSRLVILLVHLDVGIDLNLLLAAIVDAGKGIESFGMLEGLRVVHHGRLLKTEGRVAAPLILESRFHHTQCLLGSLLLLI